ncbi:A/G-specific adenine glycosylase [Mucilaginibacter sp. HMF5004]|uniref:A/G-specific adenine glycosylase n=1 Tax=Mucilaginibacter rivuli TaxID=2857527 RepID=UPI001C5DD184|nr:A/G-specific adenine glycosylase [Mucilaginibacter rivuli]MBW4888368.1 A/G-specific adenine glycosylase [Mucilaginibacter rivuli]
MNFSETIVHWYQQNKRDLPWRNTTDPYVIWLSEIILQQTRVEQGMPYFYRFAEKYPTVTHFAAASEDEVLKLWQGLGYYSRGRNMLKTAQLVKQQFNGVFPSNYNDLIALKGIGEYTAAAISSFSANQAKAVVDGNVNRVIARYFGIDEPINSTKGKKLFQQMADDLLNKEYPALHNQAMMEFGALQCKPKSPDCGICPLRDGCFAYNNSAVNTLPVKLKKLTVKNRYFNYFVVIDEDRILLNKRDDTDIWANMYDLPMIETDGEQNVEKLFSSVEMTNLFGIMPHIIKEYPQKKHILTHQHIHARLFHIAIGVNNINLKASYFFIEVEKIKNLALPKLIFLFLTKFIEL